MVAVSGFTTILGAFGGIVSGRGCPINGSLYQVTLAEWQAGQDAPPTEPWSILDIALLWSAGIWTHRILSTYRSAGSRNLTPTRVECYLWIELFRLGIMECYQVTLARKIAKKPVIERKTSIRAWPRCRCKQHSTLRSSGAREFRRITFYPHVDPLDRGI